MKNSSNYEILNSQINSEKSLEIYSELIQKIKKNIVDLIPENIDEITQAMINNILDIFWFDLDDTIEIEKIENIDSQYLNIHYSLNQDGIKSLNQVAQYIETIVNIRTAGESVDFHRLNKKLDYLFNQTDQTDTLNGYLSDTYNQTQLQWLKQISYTHDDEEYSIEDNWEIVKEINKVNDALIRTKYAKILIEIINIKTFQEYVKNPENIKCIIWDLLSKNHNKIPEILSQDKYNIEEINITLCELFKDLLSKKEFDFSGFHTNYQILNPNFTDNKKQINQTKQQEKQKKLESEIRKEATDSIKQNIKTLLIATWLTLSLSGVYYLAKQQNSDIESIQWENKLFSLEEKIEIFKAELNQEIYKNLQNYKKEKYHINLIKSKLAQLIKDITADLSNKYSDKLWNNFSFYSYTIQNEWTHLYINITNDLNKKERYELYFDYTIEVPVSPYNLETQKRRLLSLFKIEVDEIFSRTKNPNELSETINQKLWYMIIQATQIPANNFHTKVTVNWKNLDYLITNLNTQEEIHINFSIK